MNEIELFFETYKNTALAFYSFAGFIVGLSAIAYRINAMLKSKIDDAVEDAKIEQRHEFQAGYFDVQEARYNRMLDNYILLSKEMARMKGEIQGIKETL